MLRSRFQLIAAATACLGLLLVGCGDDDDDVVADPSPTETVADDGPEETYEVTAVDYGYEDVPAIIAAGTTLSLVNASDAELHELIAVRLPDDETRSVEELLELPEEELETFFSEDVDVVVALPGETDAPGIVSGDGVLDEPGRYAFICFIPVGADPQALMDAFQSGEEPEADGPPHFTRGMYAEVTVE